MMTTEKAMKDRQKIELKIADLQEDTAQLPIVRTNRAKIEHLNGEIQRDPDVRAKTGALQFLVNERAALRGWIETELKNGAGKPGRQRAVPK